jgi:asparagine synthase (glutamine-hydrolysing)
MCGICGELRLDGSRTSAQRIGSMRQAITHRGPDSDGMYFSSDGSLGLGFQRLRIIDLSADADQPMANEDGRVQVVFNGEIYNHQALRAELQARGHRFRSHTDTEVIVHLYEELGEGAISRLDGMFAIAIWDDRQRKLLLARDRAGKKPLFYLRSAAAFSFASEIKSFFGIHHLEVVPAAVPQYFVHGYVPGPATFYRDVFQVEPGTLMTVASDGRTRTSTYWSLNLAARTGATTAPTEQAAVQEVRALVTAAVERRLVSDVPLGAFLSGGVDSTIVVGLMSRLLGTPVKTFSIGFEGDPAYDETSYARDVAGRFGTEHTEFRVPASAVDLVDTLVWHHDGPFGDASAVPTYIVSQLTRQHVTVVLTGDGSDELFAGYLRFAAAVAAERLPDVLRAPLRKLLQHLPKSTNDRHWLDRGRRFVEAMDVPLLERITMLKSVFFTDLDQLLSPDLQASLGSIDRLSYLDADHDRMRGLSPLATLLHANFRSYLADDLLVKTDRCTMAHALEARSPFLDTALVEYVSGLPDSMKLNGLTTKAVLRKAFADLLPPSVAQRGKMGFGVPLGAWFRGELKDYIRDLLLDPSARYSSYLSTSYVHGLVRRHQAGETNAGVQLWSILTFETWLRHLPQWTHSPRPEPSLA